MSLRASWGSQERHPLGTCQLSSAFLTHFFRFLQHTPGTQIILVLQKRMKTFNREKPGVCVCGGGVSLILCSLLIVFLLSLEGDFTHMLKVVRDPLLPGKVYFICTLLPHSSKSVIFL